jgi:hypothetical protein
VTHEPHLVYRTAPFPFPEDRFPDGLGAVVQRTVADGTLPALAVVHDADGDWLVGDGVNDPNLPDACGLYCMTHVADADPAVAETATLPPGHAAYRDAPGRPWVVEPFTYEDDGVPTWRDPAAGSTVGRTSGRTP